MSLRTWLVQWGLNYRNTAQYYTPYHAEQFVNALTRNGTPCRMVVPQ